MFTRDELLPGEDFFTKVPTHWIRDYRMTGNGLKVLAFWASHQVGYTVSLKQTIAETGLGRDAVYAAVKCLRTLSYVVHRQGRGAGGKLTEVEYTLGPAAFTQTYDRQWGTGRPVAAAGGEPAGRTASGLSVSGEAVSGSSVSGEPAPKKIKEKKIRVPEDQEPPPAPRDVPAAPPAADAETGGSDLDETTRAVLNAAVDDAVGLRAGADGWTHSQVRQAVRAALTDGHPALAIAAKLRELAADHDGTAFPTRVKHVLAAAAAKAAVAARPPAPVLLGDGPVLGAPEGGVKYIDRERSRCGTHPGFPADNCRMCATDARVAAVEAARGQQTPPAAPPGPPPAAGDERLTPGERARRAAAAAIAAGRKTVHARERHDPAAGPDGRFAATAAAMDARIAEQARQAADPALVAA